MDNKLLNLLSHYKLDAYYGKLLILGIDTLEAFSCISDETLEKLDIPRESEDYKRLKDLAELVKSKMPDKESEKQRFEEKPEAPVYAHHTTYNEESAPRREKKRHWFVWLIVIAIIVIGGIWFDGYISADKMVNEGSLSMITLSIKVKDMNAIKKSGFMFYVEHNTDYNQRLKEFNSIFNWTK